MTFISYAQNFEDVILWRALKHISLGFYIDVGAAWPRDDSVTHAFYERGWSGINIEPNPDLYRLLCQERERDINLCLGLDSHSHHGALHLVANSGLSTLCDPFAHAHAQSGFTVEQSPIQLETLERVILQFVPAGRAIHFLKIDVEGYEERVLRGNDWSQLRPWIVVVEATLPMSQIESHTNWEGILLGANYQFVYADGINRFYLANEHAQLSQAFKYPPNVFDGFIQVNQGKAAVERLHQAQQEQALLQAQNTQLQVNYEAAQAQNTQLQVNYEAAQAQNTQLQVNYEAAQAQNTQLQANYEAMQTRVLAMLQSRSWRLTAPLRWIGLQRNYLKRDGLMVRMAALARKIQRLVRRTGWRMLSPQTHASAAQQDLTSPLRVRGKRIDRALKQATEGDS